MVLVCLPSINKMKIHKEGCEGDVCTCDAVDTPLLFEKKEKQEYDSPDYVLMYMTEQDLDTLVVIGYKGDDLIISSIGDKDTGVDPKKLLREAGKLLSKL